MKRDLTLFLEDILESINLIEKYTENMSSSEFSKRLKVQDAVARRIEIIGEAVKNLPLSFRNKYPDIPWKDIAGMRDILVHAYFGVEINKIWNIIKQKLPSLKQQIQEILKSLGKK